GRGRASQTAANNCYAALHHHASSPVPYRSCRLPAARTAEFGKRPLCGNYMCRFPTEQSTISKKLISDAYVCSTLHCNSVRDIRVTLRSVVT
ncbi:hypothetical protein, partial [Caballeronia sp. LZ043]|uniref:hypothetical protein n=1 Tax=Caballeronia sp. LZ043 TaxID=3038569 RepID=UPI002854E3CF